jgi:methyl-accepting chemotaxis protein
MPGSPSNIIVRDESRPASDLRRVPPTLRVLRPALAEPPKATRGSSRAFALDSFFVRVLASTLLISLPMVVVLGILVYTQGTKALTDSAEANVQVVAKSAGTRITDWMVQRQENLRSAARGAVDQVAQSNLNTDLVEAVAADASFDAIEIVAPNGNVIAVAGDGSDIQTVGTASWFANSLVSEEIQPIQRTNVGLIWLITTPISGSDGRSQGVVVGDLDVSALGPLLEPYGSISSTSGNNEVHVANAAHFLVYSSDWYTVAGDTNVLAKGALTKGTEGAIVDQALANGAGSSHIVDYRNHDVLAGYLPLPALGLVVIASTDSAAALAPIYDLERWGLLIEVVGSMLIVGFAIYLTKVTIGPIVALSRVTERVEAGDVAIRVRASGGREMRLLGATFNSMMDRLGHARGEVSASANRLSTAAVDLAAATYEQTTAVTATSLSMGNLAQISATIATSVDRANIQVVEVVANLQLAQTELVESGARTVALARRVNEIQGVLDLISDIANKTNLLALNAAIEAARAGESGQGFAVVADEVRRLADRSKAAVTQIAELVQGTRAQSSETVMALEKGGRQMERSVVLMQAMTEPIDVVQLATHQQRSSAEELALAIQSIAEGSRVVASTAQAIAAAATSQQRLANDLSGSGTERDASAHI